MKRQRIAITFDVDMVDYVGRGRSFDEMDDCFPIIQKILDKFPHVRTTWFIRIDAQMAAMFGRPDFLFFKHADKIEWLRARGHQIGWHHHAYKRKGDLWVQETTPEIVFPDIQKFGHIARKLDIFVARMGWGWQTNESMQILDKLGFRVDSSCIPRPNYPWETVVKDWSLASPTPYKPSKENYQIAQEPSLGLLEIPISTTHISAPNDTVSMVRYINLAYKESVFGKAFTRLLDQDLIVTITHPYEIVRNGRALHPLLSFSAEALEQNLKLLVANNLEFVTLGDVESNFSGP
ncbi:hypothetical protein N8993_08730 [Pseudomonadales bacterium]|nr:hypothetical protein [Pseudomonadales bacterium]